MPSQQTPPDHIDLGTATGLAITLLALLDAGTANLRELPTADLQALHDALGRILLERSAD